MRNGSKMAPFSSSVGRFVSSMIHSIDCSFAKRFNVVRLSHERSFFALQAVRSPVVMGMSPFKEKHGIEIFLKQMHVFKCTGPILVQIELNIGLTLLPSGAFYGPMGLVAYYDGT